MCKPTLSRGPKDNEWVHCEALFCASFQLLEHAPRALKEGVETEGFFFF